MTSGWRNPLPVAALTVLLAFVARPAWAHKILIDAWVEDAATVQGECCYADGTPLGGKTVRVLNESGAEVGQVETDADGCFSYAAKSNEAHTLQVLLPDGHSAQCTVPAEDFAVSISESVERQGDAAQEGALPVVQVAAVADGGVQAIVDGAVDRRLRRLERQIRDLREEKSMRDLLGGIGYIFGLAGVAFYFLGRNRGSSAEKS